MTMNDLRTAQHDLDLDALRARIAKDADLDVAYRIVDGPVGRLLVATTDRGIVRVAFDREDHERVLDVLADRLGPRILAAPARLDDAARQLDEYFAGRRHVFELPVDHALSSGFRLMVQQALPSIPYGSTRSYGALADAVGSPKAVRAVGSACATNPIPIVVPCHRVLRSDGSLGGYLGGLEAKAALLALESQAA